MVDETPAVGRIVLVKSQTDFPGERPGIITQVWSDTVINVNVFGDGSYDDFDSLRLTSVMHQSTVDSTPCWRWYTEEER